MLQRIKPTAMEQAHLEHLFNTTLDRRLRHWCQAVVMASRGRKRQTILKIWWCIAPLGFDHGVGHSLLVLCDAKAPHGKNLNDFKCLENYLFIVSISLF